MILIEDTRNQIGKHKVLNEQLKALGHTVVRSKLYVGDYAKINDMSVCIDTKKDWLELASNICGKQHARFRSECERALACGVKLIVLVEEQINLENWTSPVRKMTGQPICRVNPITLQKAMETMTERYNVEFMHCAKDKTAQMIISILGGEDGEKKDD